MVNFFKLKVVAILVPVVTLKHWIKLEYINFVPNFKPLMSSQPNLAICLERNWKPFTAVYNQLSTICIIFCINLSDKNDSLYQSIRFTSVIISKKIKGLHCEIHSTYYPHYRPYPQLALPLFIPVVSTVYVAPIAKRKVSISTPKYIKLS